MERIILVGYMGAGKTTVGNALAKALGMTFYEDTEYTKLDGSATFKAKTYRRVF